MFERFTKSTRAAVIEAQQQARDLHSPIIDVEHILLGVLMRPPTGRCRPCSTMSGSPTTPRHRRPVRPTIPSGPRTPRR